jgi:hypothetical protein
MKALIIQASHFELPDSFEGDLSDALRLMADYHDMRNGAVDQVLEPADKDLSSMPFSSVHSVMFDRFLTARESGKKLTGMFQFINYEAEDVIPSVE